MLPTPAPDRRDLAGGWRAAVADYDLRRAYHAADFDDSGWDPITVPGHWRSTPAFADSDGPMLQRRRFDAPPPAHDRRAWLTFDGVFYQGDVWLDGAYVGDTEGYFVSHTFEVTEQLRDRSQHALAVESTCSTEGDPTAKHNLTGVFQHGDCLDPAWNPGGIWRPVHLTETGPVRIARLRVLCREATADRAVVAFRAGTPPAAPAVSDVRRLRTGLRVVRMRGWVWSVNGERLFLKGANQGPTRMALGEATPADVGADVDWALGAGLDLLRVHAHVARPELYDAADERGLLLWQDMPLQWGYARGVRRQAARQAREAVDLLGHHPSIAVWCGHNEPTAMDTAAFRQGDPVEMRRVVRRAARGQQLPNWNRTVLDASIRRSLEKADGTRPVVTHSGVLPHLPRLDGTDSHLYF